jgi:TonB-dependent starch-binding outer membrane protein SusC
MFFNFRKLLLIMKWSAILILGACLQLSARTSAQNISLSVKNEPLVKVFKLIKDQSGIQFFYNESLLSKAHPVTIDIRDMPLQQALELCFKDQPLSFEMVEKNVVVKEKGAQINSSQNSSAPPIDVHGRVTDSAGNPIQGASITVKGTHKGIQTDANGNFTLKGISHNSTIIVSIVGYEEQQIKLGERSDIVVVMKQGVTSLHDVVISKGYYNTTDRLNTGDVTTVSGEDINKQPVTDPILALEGRVPGLFIQQTTGIPGGYSSINIMGQNSIANGNDPFYIVDGVPFSSTSLTIPNFSAGAVGSPGSSTYNTYGLGISPLNSLSPADIESIVVLKDADATAIYGSRGANGVILITTRKGRSGTTKFDLNASSGGGKVSRMMPMLNTSQYLAMRREAFQNDGLPAPSITTDPTDNNYDINGFWDTTRYTNWQKTLIGNTATFSNLEASVSGGNTNTQFLVGGGYSKQEMPYIGNYFDKKISGNISLTHTSSNRRFHVQLGVNYVYDNNKAPTSDFTEESINLAPDAPMLYDKYGNLNWQTHNKSATFANPAAATLQNAKASTDNLISDLSLSYELLPGLKLLGSFGYNHDEMHQTEYIPASAQAPPNNANPSRRRATLGITTFEKWIVEPQLNYQKNIGYGRLEALIGTTFQQNTTNYFALTASNFTSDALITDPLAAANISLPIFNNILYRYNAVYGRLGYNWNEKYLINFTARRDGSSRFGPGKLFGNFGAAGIGWVFSKEKFIQNNLSFLSFGKLRGSYGITGNDQIPDYQYLSTYSAISNTYQGATGLMPTALANPYFAWEVLKKLEGGLDLGFLNDKILFSAIYYRNRTGNQLVGYSLPYVTGFTSVQFNLPAIVQNEGVELTLKTVNIKTKNFSWSTDINLTVPSNKLVSFPNIQNYSAYADRYVVGQSLFIQKLFHSTGVNPQTGLYSFASKDPNGPDYPQDLVATKPITQKYYGGFDNKFSYKGFSLDVFVQFVDQLGFMWYESNQPGVFNQNEPKFILNRWQSAGDLTSTQRFGTASGATANSYPNYYSSDAIITNASFIRLKNLALSYQFPADFKSKSRLKNTRIYVQCQNLFTITKYLGLDPETQSFNLPPLRMITAGLQVSF